MPSARHHGANLLPLESELRGIDSGEAKKLKHLEDENRKLKHVVAELTLDNGTCQESCVRR